MNLAYCLVEILPCVLDFLKTYHENFKGVAVLRLVSG